MNGSFIPWKDTDNGYNIRIYHECEGRIEKSVPRITVWHHVMTNGDPEDRFFYPTLTQIMDSFSCSPLDTTFYS